MGLGFWVYRALAAAAAWLPAPSPATTQRGGPLPVRIEKSLLSLLRLAHLRRKGAQGFRFRVQGLGLRNLVCEVQGKKSKVWGLWFRV